MYNDVEFSGRCCASVLPNNSPVFVIDAKLQTLTSQCRLLKPTEMFAQRRKEVRYSDEI